MDLTALFAEERGMKVDVTEGDVGEMVTSRKDRALDWHGSLCEYLHLPVLSTDLQMYKDRNAFLSVNISQSALHY